MLVISSTIIFLLIIFILVTIILIAEKKLVPQGDVKILINGNEDKSPTVKPGGTLLAALSAQNVFLPSACGGGGTCAMCKCQIHEGGGDILPTELTHISRSEAKENWRLACQVKVRNDMDIQIPDEIFSIQKWECTVKSNRSVATFIKELIVELPAGDTIDFKSGGYIQIDIPKYKLSYSEFDIENEYREDWDKFKMWDLVAQNNEEGVFRAYSMANHPAEGNIVMLNVRIAHPPPNKWDAPPGIASSYIFNLKPGDKVTISGPYGEFFINPSDAEMLYIGGGAGMAPMRSHLYQLFKTLKTGRKVSYWYGGRSRAELFYIEHFRSLEREFPNFKFYIVLSDAKEEDKWIEKKDLNDKEGDGFIGFVHQVVIDQYLTKHEAPEDIELYFCGPPMMNKSCLQMAEDWGIPDENVRFDDFGG